MPGVLEIAIVVVILLVLFGYKRLPQLGRRAGEGVNEARTSVEGMIGEKADPKVLGRKAGEGVRELREFKSAVLGEDAPAPAKNPAAAGDPQPEAEQAEQPDPEPEPVDGELVNGKRSG